MPTSVAVFGYLLAFGAGVSFVFQQAVNANLRVEIGSPWWAGFVSYLGGTIAMLLMAALLLQPLPSTQMIYRSHWLSWTGGLFGAIYIAISIILLPRLSSHRYRAYRGRTNDRFAYIRSIRSVRRSRPSTEHAPISGRSTASVGCNPRSALASTCPL